MTKYMRDILHCLLVQQCLHFRISSIVWHHFICNALAYLLELFIFTSLCSGLRSLHLAFRGDCVVPHARPATRQNGAFSNVGPSAWHSLPPDLRSLLQDLCCSFYKLLKTFLWVSSASE